jgi:hypothetical protein
MTQIAAAAVSSKEGAPPNTRRTAIMKRIMRRYNITFCFVLTCALIIITLWIMNEAAGGGNGGGLLYRVAAPILSLGTVGTLSEANGNGIS